MFRPSKEYLELSAQKAPGKLTGMLIADPQARQHLLGEIARIAQDIYAQYKNQFIASLSVFNQHVYQEITKIPYAAKDWWRDLHDIIVTWSISAIVAQENSRLKNKIEGEQLPEWLVTAALLHDRGYGILASQANSQGNSYQARQGAHWENSDTRVLHSSLSRKLAQVLFFKATLEDKSPALNAITLDQIDGFQWKEDRDTFLKVIEAHDYPLIGRLRELPAIGRHHFDADSLYSISLSSFVKDYLSYLSDPEKMEFYSRGGLCQPQEYTLRHLLMVRMARYFISSDHLPQQWDQKKFPLIPELVQFAEGSICIEPSSATALRMTGQAFWLLSKCCKALEQVDSTEEFLQWFLRNHSLQLIAYRNSCLSVNKELDLV
jgi:hypothetical protein